MASAITTSASPMPLTPIEYKRHRVITLAMIDSVHQRAEGTAKRNFSTNRDRLIDGTDFFTIGADEFRTRLNPGHSKFANEDVALLTESGYLLLVKSFTDDLAWRVQRELVNGYFRSKAAAAPEVEVAGLPLSAAISAQQQSWRLMDRIKAENAPMVRTALYIQLARIMTVQGIEPPPLTSLGYEAPAVPPAVAEFWQAVEALEAAGVRINHSRIPGVVAVRLQEVFDTAKAMGLKVAPPPVLKRVLRLSKRPRFDSVKSVASAIDCGTVHAWVFERQTDGGEQ